MSQSVVVCECECVLPNNQCNYTRLVSTKVVRFSPSTSVDLMVTGFFFFSLRRSCFNKTPLYQLYYPYFNLIESFYCSIFFCLFPPLFSHVVNLLQSVLNKNLEREREKKKETNLVSESIHNKGI